MRPPTPSCEVKTLAQALLDEQARCRELLAAYKAIFPAGEFGYFMISQALSRAEAAVMAGDTVAMLRCYDELKGCE